MTSTVLETTIITILRVTLFLSCRKLLMKSLYSDLRNLSSSSSAGLPDTPTSAQTEFEMLPTPTTAGRTPTNASKRRPTPVHSTISQLVFSACFSESCTMFALLMCQAFHIFGESTRYLNWRISLYILMLLIVLLVPISLSLCITLSTSDSPRNFTFVSAIFSIIPVLLYLLLLSYIPLPPGLFVNNTMDFTTSLLSRLVVLGTIVLGLLSGFGAVSNSWEFIPPALRGAGKNTIPSVAQVEVAEDALDRVRGELAKKRMDIQRQAKSNSSWLSRMIGSSSSDLQELAGLEALEYQMTLSLESQKDALQRARFSSTLLGRILNFGGMIFAAYCAIRILSCIIHIIFPTSGGTTTTNDLITHALVSLAALLFSSETIPTERIILISRDISLLLVGVIIATSIRLVLRGVTRALRVTSRNLSASFMLLFLAQLMGIYLLSTLIQLRTTFPPQAGETNLFATLPEYELFGGLFDWSFVLSALGSAAAKWIGERVGADLGKD
ncbi:G protein-coupled receptor 89 [Flagelloscypha sp. PMI_526]|nr:G protein-coupled receptor 89 [Flagelloscypha sp. PMI_526]